MGEGLKTSTDAQQPRGELSLAAGPEQLPEPTATEPESPPAGIVGAVARARRPLIFFLVALSAVSVGATAIPGLPAAGVALDDIATVIAAAAAAFLCAVAGLAVSGRERRGWLLTAGGFALGCVAEVIWAYSRVVLGRALPYPSVADWFYLALPPLAFVGILHLVPATHRFRWALTIFDSFLFTFALCGLLYGLVIVPTLGQTAGVSGLEMLLVLAYPVTDLLVVFALVSLFLSWDLGRVHRPALALTAGMIVTVIADMGFAAEIFGSSFGSGGIFDPVWTIGYALVAGAGLERLQESSGPLSTYWSTSLNLKRMQIVRLIIPYLALPVVGILIFNEWLRRTESIDTNFIVVAIFSVVILVLVLVRQFLTLLENLRLSRSLAARTKELATLNQVATDLSHKLTTAEVMDTGLAFACQVTGAVSAAAWLCGEHGMRLAATSCSSDDEHPCFITLLDESHAIREAVDRKEASSVEISPDLLPGQPLTPRLRGTTLLILPLTARDALVGSLGILLAREVRLTISQRQEIEAIAAQVGVAVANARQYERTRYLAERDPLTGLLNRRTFQARLAHDCLHAARADDGFSLVMIDLDDFKRLNDTLGHQAGDEALRRVANHLRSSLRENDVVARYGGDEFVALLTATDEEAAHRLLARVSSQLPMRELTPGGPPIDLAMSYGIAFFPEDGSTSTELIEAADRRLYAAKTRAGSQAHSGSPIDSAML